MGGQNSKIPISDDDYSPFDGAQDIDINQEEKKENEKTINQDKFNQEFEPNNIKDWHGRRKIFIINWPNHTINKVVFPKFSDVEQGIWLDINLNKSKIIKCDFGGSFFDPSKLFGFKKGDFEESYIFETSFKEVIFFDYHSFNKGVLVNVDFSEIKPVSPKSPSNLSFEYAVMKNVKFNKARSHINCNNATFENCDFTSYQPYYQEGVICCNFFYATFPSVPATVRQKGVRN